MPKVVAKKYQNKPLSPAKLGPVTTVQEPKSVAEHENFDIEQQYSLLVKWKGRPLAPEDPQKIEDFCAIYKISPERLKELVNRPSFADDCLKESMNWGKQQVPTMLRLMSDNARISKSSNDAMKFIEAVSALSKDRDKITTNNTQTNIFLNVSDDKLARIAQRLVKDLPEQQ